MWADGPCMSGLAEGMETQRLIQVIVTHVTLSLRPRRPLDCLLRFLYLWRLVFWVGLEWFLTGFFHVLWKSSPLLF